MLKFILTTILILSSLVSSIASQAQTTTTSSSLPSNLSLTQTQDSPNRQLGKKELGKMTTEDYDVLNCQIAQNQSVQQIKEYQLITQNFLNDVQSGKIKIYEKESKLQQFLLKSSNKIENINKANIATKDYLSKIEKYDCKKEKRFSRRYAIPQSKNLIYLKTVLNQAANKSSGSGEVNSSIIFTNCKIDSDTMTARWNATGNKQINNIKDWEEYLDKVTNDNSKIIDRNQLESAKLEFKKAKEKYQKLFAESKENYLSRQCSTDSKANKITNETASDKAKVANKRWSELKKIFESIKI
jgi:hypothetical protein